MVTIVEAVCVQKHLDDARACTLCILSAVDVAAATHVHAVDDAAATHVHARTSCWCCAWRRLMPVTCTPSVYLSVCSLVAPKVHVTLNVNID